MQDHGNKFTHSLQERARSFVLRLRESGLLEPQDLEACNSPQGNADLVCFHVLLDAITDLGIPLERLLDNPNSKNMAGVLVFGQATALAIRKRLSEESVTIDINDTYVFLVRTLYLGSDKANAVKAALAGKAMLKSTLSSENPGVERWMQDLFTLIHAYILQAASDDEVFKKADIRPVIAEQLKSFIIGISA